MFYKMNTIVWNNFNNEKNRYLLFHEKGLTKDTQPLFDFEIEKDENNKEKKIFKFKREYGIENKISSKFDLRVSKKRYVFMYTKNLKIKNIMKKRYAQYMMVLILYHIKI